MVSFKPKLFEEHILRVERAGIILTTLAEEKKRDPDWLDKVYDLHTTVMADVPSSNPVTPVLREEFRRGALGNPHLIWDGYFLAEVGGEYVGESFVWRLPAEPGHLSQGFTGVRREYRGQGVAMALKLKVIEYAQTHGYTHIKTWNATTNKPMLAINEKLGCQLRPGKRAGFSFYRGGNFGGKGGAPCSWTRFLLHGTCFPRGSLGWEWRALWAPGNPEHHPLPLLGRVFGGPGKRRGVRGT